MIKCRYKGHLVLDMLDEQETFEFDVEFAYGDNNSLGDDYLPENIIVDIMDQLNIDMDSYESIVKVDGEVTVEGQRYKRRIINNDNIKRNNRN